MSTSSSVISEEQAARDFGHLTQCRPIPPKCDKKKCQRYQRWLLEKVVKDASTRFQTDAHTLNMEGGAEALDAWAAVERSRRRMEAKTAETRQLEEEFEMIDGEEIGDGGGVFGSEGRWRGVETVQELALALEHGRFCVCGSLHSLMVELLAVVKLR